MSNEPDSRSPALANRVIRLLVVDDDPLVARAIARHGARDGFEVTVTGDGRSAMYLALENEPDAIVLDIGLPEIDGRDVLTKLRATGYLERHVVVMLSGHDTQEDRLLGLELGADDYETKPCEPQLLLRKVRRLLMRKNPTPRLTLVPDTDAA
jgi:two-component system, OmpR family, response regulator